MRLDYLFKVELSMENGKLSFEYGVCASADIDEPIISVSACQMVQHFLRRIVLKMKRNLLNIRAYFVGKEDQADALEFIHHYQNECWN